MRNAFIDELIEITDQGVNSFLIVGDLGYGVIEKFQDKYPKRFLNAGVAEQNMIGMAAGLASSGYKVFVYSIANFPVFRCLEQIRNDVCYHSLDVNIVAVGAGLSYGTAGYSHHAIDDIGAMRSLPGLRIFTPSNTNEVRIAVRESIAKCGPNYLRLDKGGQECFPNAKNYHSPFWVEYFSGEDLLIISSGEILSECLVAAELLLTMGINVTVASVGQIKPLSLDLNRVESFCQILIVEEHSILGGLFTAFAEYAVLHGFSQKISRIGIPDSIHAELGSQKYLRQFYGIDARGIATAAFNFLNN